MKKSINLILILFITSCGYNQEVNNKQDEKLILINVISNLDFIKNKENELKMLDSNFNSLDYLPQDSIYDNKFEIIKVGYNSSLRLEFLFTFYCNIEERKIYLYDAIKDELIDLKITF